MITIDKRGKAKKTNQRSGFRSFKNDEEFRKRLDELIEEDMDVLISLGRE